MLAEHAQGAKFSLLNFIRSQTELCRVLVRATNFPYLKRYPMLVLPNPKAGKGRRGRLRNRLEFQRRRLLQLMPLAASEIKGRGKFQLLSVNEAEERANPCRHLVVQARRPLGTDGQGTARTGIADVLSRRAHRHQIPDARGTGSPVHRVEAAGLSRHAIARMALRPPRHELGRHDQSAQSAARKTGETFSLQTLELVRKQGAHDTTQKFLWRLRDRSLIESVLIPANPALYGEASDRHTLCISTQVGCAYGCKFCASGLDGWKRNLTPDEIVEQVLAVERLERKPVEGRESRVERETGQAVDPSTSTIDSWTTSSSWAWANRWRTTTIC